MCDVLIMMMMMTMGDVCIFAYVQQCHKHHTNRHMCISTGMCEKRLGCVSKKDDLLFYVDVRTCDNNVCVCGIIVCMIWFMGQNARLTSNIKYTFDNIYMYHVRPMFFLYCRFRP